MKGADSGYVCPVQKVLRKRVFGGFSPFLCCPEKWSGLNRISDPHWEKICDDHNGRINLRAKQKYEVRSATTVQAFFQPSFCKTRISNQPACILTQFPSNTNFKSPCSILSTQILSNTDRTSTYYTAYLQLDV